MHDETETREPKEAHPNPKQGERGGTVELDAAGVGAATRRASRSAALSLEGTRLVHDAELPNVSLIQAPCCMRQSPALLNPYFSFSITHGNPISSLSDGRLVAVPTGVVALIEPNTIISNRAQLFGYESILFGPETMGSMLAEVTGAEQSFGGGMTILHGAVLAEAFSRAAELLSRPSALLEREEGLHRFVELVARYFPRQREASRVSASTVRIRRAREYLDAAALEAQNPSLTDLANLTGISKFGLLRAFKRELGITPHAYLVQQRLHRAKVLMKGGASVSEAASLAGFADKSHLTRQFRNSFGITPGAIKGPLSRVPRPD